MNLLLVWSCLLLASCGGSGVSELIPLYDGETYVYFNSKGEVAVKPEVNVEKASMFRDGLALVGVKTDEGVRYGFLNMKGELEIRPQYLSATTFSEGLAWVVEPNGAPKAIDRKGEEVFSLPEVEEVMMFTEGLALFSKKDSDGEQRMGYVDKKGKVVIEPFYKEVKPFSNGLAVVRTVDKYGYINRKGEMVIPEQFADASIFTGNFAVAGISRDHWGVIDKKGSFVINPKYGEITIDGNEFLVAENNRCGIVDKSGNTIVPMDFKILYPFYGKGYTMATLDGDKYGVVDRKGKYTVNPQFDFGFGFIGGVAVVVSGKQYGIIDAKGKYIVNPRYKSVSEDFILMFLSSNLSVFSTVQSDYLDMDAIVSAIVEKGSGSGYQGVSASSTHSDVKAIYPKLASPGYFGSSHTSNDDVPLSGDVYISSVAFTFNGPVSRQEYNYYERKYRTIDLKPTVKTAVYEILFRNSRAQNKSGAVAEAVGKAIDSHYTDGDASFNVSRSGSGIKIKVTYSEAK